jgi:prepilin-type N-terminal cleavage/methylation domain-containing protein
MPLKPAPRRQAGFTLLELLAATSIALVTSLAVTAAVVSAQHAVSRSAARAQAQAQAASVLEELRALPCASSDSSALLAAVFPHARPELGGAEAFFSDQAYEGHPPGTFFTHLSLGGASAWVAATFVSAQGSGWSPVSTSALLDYTPAAPPSDALMLCVMPAAGTPGRALVTVVRSAGVAPDAAAGVGP